MFAPNSTGRQFEPFLFEYVDTFVPKQSGEHINPNVSAGGGPLTWLLAREAEPFEIYQGPIGGLTTRF